jgi:hypothetical protein
VIFAIKVGNGCCFKALESGIGVKYTIRQTIKITTTIIKRGNKINLTIKDDTRIPTETPLISIPHNDKEAWNEFVVQSLCGCTG